MRRLFWLGMGIAVGVLAVRRVTKTAEAFTPRGVSRSVSGSIGEIGSALGEFVATVKAASADREAELRKAASTEKTTAHHRGNE